MALKMKAKAFCLFALLILHLFFLLVRTFIQESLPTWKSHPQSSLALLASVSGHQALRVPCCRVFDVPDIHVHPSCSLLLLPLDKAGPLPACISDAIHFLRTGPGWCTWKEAQPAFTAATLLLQGEQPSHQ